MFWFACLALVEADVSFPGANEEWISHVKSNCVRQSPRLYTSVNT